MKSLPPGLWLAALLLLAACGESGPRLPPLADDAVILAFGDSLTRGTGAREDESYPAVLARLSGRQVINAGVPGELSAGGRARLARLLDEVKPQLLILCHGGNDLLRRHNRATAAANLEGMLGAARSRGIPALLLGVPLPGLWLATAEFYAGVAERTATPLEADALADILADATLKADPVHPNAAGYRRLAERIHARLVALGAF